MKTLLSILLMSAFALTASAVVTRNDDSCDIALLPAATLLLPYFEVDLEDPNGGTTRFTITNVTNLDQIARVTLWTDRAYPVFTFNVYLTGYDVQKIDLFDILERGVIAPDAGTGTGITGRGKFSDRNTSLDLPGCTHLPGPIDDITIARLQSAFLDGTTSDCDGIGDPHENAVGYATIDVVHDCSANTPADRAYWTRDLGYENVLIGDYQQTDGPGNDAAGGPLVHIRAMPDREFPRTFYARYLPSQAKRSDARQPLPAQFAARFIEQTSFKIWREARAGAGARCDDYDDELAVADIVIFDEEENAAGIGDFQRATLPATSVRANGGEDLPRLPNGAKNGWMYFNLDRTASDDFASQAWVISSKGAEGFHSTEVHASALANGCSPAADRGKRIEPANEDDSCDIAQLPAATLLLPYFSVDIDDPNGEQTLLTVTNVSPEDRIARVTLWTDYAFPVITFNVYLTGYDVQSISLYDVIERGFIAPDRGTGTAITPRGPLSKGNHTLDLSACAQLVGHLPEEWIVRMKTAFIEGTVPDLSAMTGCNNVGNEHDNAVGYATIDVVRNCSTNGPLSVEYWTEDLAFDNVLIGDSHLVFSRRNTAQGSPMVHIRAIPEGGTAAERMSNPRQYDSGFHRTFYSSYQPLQSPKLDGRQPLPSVFAAPWAFGQVTTGSFTTDLKIWRETRTGRNATCPTWDDNVAALAEIVVFDENENAVGDANRHNARVVPMMPVPEFLALPATARINADDSSVFPWLANGAVSGWMYLNLDNDERQRFTGVDFVNSWPSQNWVIATMYTANGRSFDLNAAAFGNGCSPQAPFTEVTRGTAILGPRP